MIDRRNKKYMKLRYATRKLNRDIIHLVDGMIPSKELRTRNNYLALMGLYETYIFEMNPNDIDKSFNRWMVEWAKE